MVILLSCADPDVPTGDLAPLELLTRATLDLRGTRPTIAEVEALEADPAALDGLLELALSDERVGRRVGDMWSELYLTRTDQYGVSAASIDVDDELTYIASIGDEPLRVLGYVAENDLPWSEIVTGDWTMANAMLASVWPVEYPEGSDGWVKSRYTDGRPTAGVLSGNALWWRYTSTESNANRKRANVVSKLFLCNDYLIRPLEFDRTVDLLDEDAVQAALTNNPSCVNCHNSLDPLASYLFGFWWFDNNDGPEASFYHAERERLWTEYTAVEPAYFGQPGASLSELGVQIADDPRFVSCAVEQAWQLLLRRDPSLEDTDALVRHRNAFIAGGLTMRTLLASIVADPAYRSSTDARLVSPSVLASEIEDLTGFRWTTAGGHDVLALDVSGIEDKGDILAAEAVGYRTLAGGADGYNVTRTATEPSTTMALVHERIAEAAGWYVVHAEPDRLLPDLTFDEAPGDDAMVVAIQALHARFFGARVAPDGPEVEAALELWRGLYAVQHDTRAAWAGVISALLRDPRLLVY